LEKVFITINSIYGRFLSTGRFVFDFYADEAFFVLKAYSLAGSTFVLSVINDTLVPNVGIKLNHSPLSLVLEKFLVD